MSNIEERARELDEIRRSKAIRRSDIDEDLYAEPEDLSKSVINSNAVIDQMWQDILAPGKDDSAVMPCQRPTRPLGFDLARSRFTPDQTVAASRWLRADRIESDATGLQGLHRLV
jgi:hypothetical protein